MPETPIGPYPVLPLAIRDPEPASAAVASRVAALVVARRSDLVVEHIGSTAVPGLAGKAVVDLGISPEDPADVPAITELLLGLGFQSQGGSAPWPVTRPMLMGGLAPGDGDDRPRQIHLHVIPDPANGLVRSHFGMRFAPTPRGSPLRGAEARARRIRAQEWRPLLDGEDGVHPGDPRRGRRRRAADPAGATIGILGGGQLGRMLGFAARALGYRVAILDPDPLCPAR